MRRRYESETLSIERRVNRTSHVWTSITRSKLMVRDGHELHVTITHRRLYTLTEVRSISMSTAGRSIRLMLASDSSFYRAHDCKKQTKNITGNIITIP